VSVASKTKLLTPCEFKVQIAQEGRVREIVEKLCAESSVNIAVGDSGLGKSPLFYQFGIAVASGLPFLSFKTVKGKVAYFDFENSHGNSDLMADAVTQHLQLKETPPDFLRWPGDVPPTNPELENYIKENRPVLVILDSLRAFSPTTEEKNHLAGRFIGELRLMARKYHVAFYLIHHVKKPSDSEGHVLELEESLASQWLMQACGARALINQTDTRIGFQYTDKRGDACLIAKGLTRVHGEFGPLYIDRAFDEEAEPLGYRRVGSVELLRKDQQDAYVNLPPTFRFKEAQTIYGKSAQPTKNFLTKCSGLQLVEKMPKGYRKVPPEPVPTFKEGGLAG
jgi:hypothetical protein